MLNTITYTNIITGYILLTFKTLLLVLLDIIHPVILIVKYPVKKKYTNIISVVNKMIIIQ
jgi:hypothetical protein